jgi:hypothetical protein
LATLCAGWGPHPAMAGWPPPAALSAFGKLYASELKSLRNTDRNAISVLAELAADNAAEGPSVAAAIVQHVRSVRAHGRRETAGQGALCAG